MSDEQPPSEARLKKRRDRGPQPGTALVKKQPEKNPVTGQFVPGNIGGGRTLGARNRFTEAFIEDFRDVWREHGMKALREVARRDPGTFVRAAVQLMPKDLLLDARGAGAHVGVAGDGFNDRGRQGIVLEAREPVVGDDAGDRRNRLPGDRHVDLRQRLLLDGVGVGLVRSSIDVRSAPDSDQKFKAMLPVCLCPGPVKPPIGGTDCPACFCGD